MNCVCFYRQAKFANTDTKEYPVSKYVTVDKKKRVKVQDWYSISLVKTATTNTEVMLSVVVDIKYALPKKCCHTCKQNIVNWKFIDVCGLYIVHQSEKRL